MTCGKLDFNSFAEKGLGQNGAGNRCNLVGVKIQDKADRALPGCARVRSEFLAENSRCDCAYELGYVHAAALRSGFSTYAHASDSRRSSPKVRRRLSSRSELA